MGLQAPVGQVETLAGSSERFVFPEGNYEAVLDQVHIGEIPTDDEGNPYSGWESAEGTVLSLQFGTIVPVEVEDMETAEQIGERKYFVKITLNDGDVSIEDIDISAKNEPRWQLQRSARTLLNFLRATGHAEEVDGNIVVPDEVIELLEQGELNGSTVGMTIVNRRESTQRFKQRLQSDPEAVRATYDNLGGFFAL